MTPLEKYQRDLQENEFSADEAQALAVKHTQRLYDALCASEGVAGSGGFIDKLKTRFSKTGETQLKGLYFWGGVGRGKTYLVDAFFESLPLDKKYRIHFHRFMQMIHAELKKLNDIQDPLSVVAENIAEKYRVICFDEFHVSDITDAMLLGGLFKVLFEKGVVLVTTSNQHPDKLYWEGLQRERFFPAIELLKEYTEVLNIDGGVDYRFRYLDKAEIYHSPIDEKADKILLDNFQHLAPDDGRENSNIEIEGRKINTIRQADGVVWFSFEDICEGPRGPADYIELGRQFQTVLISNVPVLDNDSNDAAKRFMMLVDEFYDRSVKLIISAEAEPENLYQGKKLAKQFRRTISRLFEMQTHDYLAEPHIPD
jgi:cell division protein ZapE